MDERKRMTTRFKELFEQKQFFRRNEGRPTL